MKLTNWEIIRFDKGKSTSHHIAFYDTEIVAQAVANAINTLDKLGSYGSTVVLEPWLILPRLAISSQIHFCCDKCDQPV